MSLLNIQKAINNFKALIENSIVENGVKGKEAMIRSSRPILNLHEAVKVELIKAGVDKDLIFPPLNSRTPELKLAGSRKQKIKMFVWWQIMKRQKKFCRKVYYRMLLMNMAKNLQSEQSQLM